MAAKTLLACLIAMVTIAFSAEAHSADISSLRTGLNDTNRSARAAHVDRLVNDLGHGWFQRREAAKRELKKLGVRAVEPLLRAGQRSVFTVSHQAKKLLVEMAVADGGIHSQLCWIANSKTPGSNLAARILHLKQVEFAHATRVQTKLDEQLALAKRAFAKRDFMRAIEYAMTCERLHELNGRVLDASQFYEFLERLCDTGLQNQVDQKFGNDSKRVIVSKMLLRGQYALKAGKLKSAIRLAKYCQRFNVEYGPFDDRPEYLEKAIQGATRKSVLEQTSLRLMFPAGIAEAVRAVRSVHERARSSDSRARQLIFHSEDLRHVPEIWERAWEMEMPDVATPYRTHGGVI
jgi:hypothetical protein